MPPATPISNSLGWKLGKGLANSLSKRFMTAIILSEAFAPSDTLHSHATLSQKYPTKIYGRFKSTSFLVSIPPAFAFRFFGIAFRSLDMPSMMLLKGSALCPYSFPGSVLCPYSFPGSVLYSYSVILHP